jgi:outer membrane lipopolysaccharide assembly protein LptE/RlpB
VSKRIKIVFLDAITVGKVDNLDAISSLGDYTGYQLTMPAQRTERIRGHNVVVTNKVVIDRDVMDACPELEQCRSGLCR